MIMAEAPLCRFIDRWTVEYARTYPHPIERVWRAVSDPVQVGIWFWGPGRGEPKLGSAFHFGADDSGFDGVISVFEPPRRVRYSFPKNGPDAYLQYDLAPVGNAATRLVFVQRLAPGAPADMPWHPVTLVGWHRSLDHLGVLMDGGTWRKPDNAALEQAYREHTLATLP